MNELVKNSQPDGLPRGGLARRFRSALGRRSTHTSTPIVGTSIEPAREVLKGKLIETRIARLPKELLETDTLAQLQVGDSVYAVPWAMAVSQDGYCVLNGSYTYHREQGGTIQMLVRRTEEGYEVHVPQGYKYSPDKNIPWVGAIEEDLLPVSKVKKAHWRY